MQGKGGGTDLLVTDPGEPGSRTGGDACRLIKGTASWREAKVCTKKNSLWRRLSLAKSFFLF